MKISGINWVDIADKELWVAFYWYEERREGLGVEFAGCVDAGLERLVRHPFIGRPIRDDVRRILIRRFPYILYYRIVGDEIEVVGFRHHKQDSLEFS